MNTPSLRLVGFSFALLAIVSAGCAKHASTGPSSDNYLQLAMTAEPTTFDPAMVQDGTTIDLLQQVYEGLVQWTPDNKLAPALATSWDISNGGRTYTFHLRDGVKFQSGDPVTANDVVFSLTRALDPKLGSTVGLTYLGDIVGASDLNSGKAKTLAGVKVIDDHTVAITISKPKAYWVDTLTYPTGYVVNPNAVSKNAAGMITDANTDGTGAFKLTTYQQGSKIELAANPAYWQGKPQIAGERRWIVTDATTRHAMYIRGNLDVTDESSGSLDADQADSSLKGQVTLFPRASTFYLALNQSPQAGFAPFKDKRVREAFAYATDKKRIVDVVFGGQRTVAEDILPQGIPGYDPGFRGLPYDPAKAKALMAAAGYPGGSGFPPLAISYREAYPDIAKTVDLLGQMYKENLGVTVQSQQTEWATLLSDEDKGALPSFHIRWMADYLDAQDYYSVLYRTGSEENTIGYSNPAYDKICDQADIDPSPAKRLMLYHQAAVILRDDVPRIPLYYQRDAELVKPYVHGLRDCLMGHLPHWTVTLGK